ncbi:hypothetical protein Tco_1437717 [Tanacetum coccineum]
MIHPSPKRNMIPKAVLMRSGLVTLTTARPVNTVQPITIVNSARQMTHISKSAHPTIKWPIHKNTTFKNSNFNQRVNIVKDKNVNTDRPKAVVNVVKGNNVNVVKASACWVWKPKTKVLDHVSKHNNYEEIDRGYVAFGGNPKEGKITGKCTIKTGSGPNWLFDIDALTKLMNYKPVVAGNQSNGNSCTKACNDAGKASMETVSNKDYILLPLCTADPPFSQSSKISPNDGSKPSSDDGKQLSKVDGCGGLGGSRLTWSDKEVTMQYLELKGSDRGTCKLLGDVIEVLGCLLEELGCLNWVKMLGNGCRVHFISG